MKSEEEMKTKEYWAWCDMMAKCYDTRHPEFETHGGRGIQVCQRWHEYENFLEDVGRCPEDIAEC
jgi:hypothetical protein